MVKFDHATYVAQRTAAKKIKDGLRDTAEANTVLYRLGTVTVRSSAFHNYVEIESANAALLKHIKSYWETNHPDSCQIGEIEQKGRHAKLTLAGGDAFSWNTVMRFEKALEYAHTQGAGQGAWTQRTQRTDREIE